jgi:phage baseplate assembly protein gpV
MISQTTFGAGRPGTPGSLDESGQSQKRRFFGKYRGKVTDNVDPLFLGRVLPTIPAISPDPLTWAMPCTPYAGSAVGFYAIPPISANVWIEFEAGDPDYPIWTGCFWEEGQIPTEAPNPDMFIFQTTSFSVIMTDIAEGGSIIIEAKAPAIDPPITITLNSEGVSVVTEATITLTSTDTTMNSDTLTIESPETNLTAETLTIEGGETNLTCESLDIECAGESNILSTAITIEAAETNIAGAEFSVESADSNFAGNVSIEGTLDVLGVITEDGAPVMVIPVA